MKKDRKELEEVLFSLITELKAKRKITAEINRQLAALGVLEGTFQLIAKGDLRLSDIDLALLCLLTMAIYEATRHSTADPAYYFTNREMEEARKYTGHPVIHKTMKLPIVLPDVIKLDTDESYVTKISIQRLAEIYHSGLIDYDFETQRSPNYRKKQGQLLEVADVNLTSVKEICDHILNGTYLPDTITLNAYSDFEDAILYDDATRQLSIHTVTTILDGFHRLQGIVRALSIQPGIDMDIQLAIKSYAKEKAKNYFGQINTINRVDQARLKELKLARYADSIVHALRTRTDSDFRGRMTSGMTVSKVAGHLTTSMILSNAIDMNFEIKSKMEEKMLAQYLIDFFNHLLGLFPEQFLLNPDQYRAHSYINHAVMFYGYVTLARRFKEENMDLMKIKPVIEAINFSRQQSEFRNLFGDTVRDTMAIRRKLKQFFDELTLNP